MTCRGGTKMWDKYVMVKCLHVVKLYDKAVGGVDLLGQCISLYRTEMCLKKRTRRPPPKKKKRKKRKDILDLKINFNKHCPVSSESAEAINAHKMRQTMYVSRTG